MTAFAAQEALWAAGWALLSPAWLSSGPGWAPTGSRAHQHLLQGAEVGVRNSFLQQTGPCPKATGVPPAPGVSLPLSIFCYFAVRSLTWKTTISIISLPITVRLEW